MYNPTLPLTGAGAGAVTWYAGYGLVVTCALVASGLFVAGVIAFRKAAGVQREMEP